MPVYKDKNGNFYVKLYYTDYTGTRKQKLKRGFKFQRDAKAWERDFLAGSTGSVSMSFNTLAEKYLADQLINNKLISYKARKNRITKWLLPVFGSQPIDAITPAAVRSWQNELKTATKPDGSFYSPHTLQNIVSDLSDMLNYAVRFYGLTKNPVKVSGITAGHKVRSINFWTLEEFNRFIATFDALDPLRPAFLVLYWTGCRLGEMLALTAADLEAGQLNINKTWHVIDGQGRVTAPKTRKSVRTVTIPPELEAVLHDHLKRFYGLSDDTRLFPFSVSHVEREFKAHLQLAGVKRIRLHDLRHSHASLLIELGFSAVLVAERLGHENVSTTLNIYTHLFPNKQSQVAERLQALIVSNQYQKDEKEDG